MRHNLHMGGLLITQRKAIAAHLERDRIAQRRPPQNFHRRPIAKPHLQQSTANFIGAANGNHMAMAPHGELVEGTSGFGSDVRATSEVTGLLHMMVSVPYTNGCYSS